jgi:large subunit ribosomal protein L20
MPRATNAPARKARKKKVFKRARGFYGAQHNVFRVAANKVRRAMAFSYIGRRLKKRDFRTLWNIRIGAAAKLLGTNYSKLIHGLKLAKIELDRKILADIAVHDPDGFARIAELARG